MSDMDSYFKNDTSEHDSYPLIRLLEAQREKQSFGEAKVEIIRPRAPLGFEPAKLSLQFFDKEDKFFDYKTELWDADLNDALVDRKIRAIDEPNEIRRFGLALGPALERPENRYGDGFFRAVLMLVVDQSPLADTAPVRALRPYIGTNRPYEGGHSAEDCGIMIQAVLKDRWLELSKKLNYDQAKAERILAGALAYYLDERFGITDGQKLGWLKAN